MIHLKIIKEEFNTNKTEIEKFESLYSLKLPEDYKDFLLKYNGFYIYPNYPTVQNEKNYELSLMGVRRFLSVGDLFLQKLYPLYYTYYDDQSEGGELNRLKKENNLIFALTDRGDMYFFNLSEDDYGQIYWADTCGTMVKINTKSFTTFINSFDLYPEERETKDYNFDFKLSYSHQKIFEKDLFYTPNKPDLGLQRFKEVFEVCGDIQPTENGHRNLPQTYVNDKLKLEYLLSMGCKKDGLLNYATDSQIVKFLVNDIGLNINEPYNGRYPLQNFLTYGNGYESIIKYKLIDELLEMGIELDWSIQGKKWNGEPDLPFIDKLKKLQDEYYKNEQWEKGWKKNDFVPFYRSINIEHKLNGR